MIKLLFTPCCGPVYTPSFSATIHNFFYRGLREEPLLGGVRRESVKKFSAAKVIDASAPRGTLGVDHL